MSSQSTAEKRAAAWNALPADERFRWVTEENRSLFRENRSLRSRVANYEALERQREPADEGDIVQIIRPGKKPITGVAVEFQETFNLDHVVRVQDHRSSRWARIDNVIFIGHAKLDDKSSSVPEIGGGA